MNESDYKSLLGTYQRKTMDLFTQLVVAESKIQILESQLSECNKIIEDLKKQTLNSNNQEEDFI